MAKFEEKVHALRKAAAFGMVLAVVALLGTYTIHEAALELPVFAASAPSYSADVAPILQKNCLSCHSSEKHKSGLILESYSALLQGGKHGHSIVPHDAKGSLMVQMLEGDVEPQMPADADPLSATEIDIIKAWINAGAEGPVTTEATLPLRMPSTPDIPPEVEVVSPVTSVKFSPDGKILAVGGYREVRLVDPASGKVLATLPGHANYVRSLAFSPDGGMLAAAGGPPQISGEIKIWDTNTHQLIRTLEGHRDCIYSIAWSPNGKVIASGSYDKMVKLWDAATGKELKNLQDHIDAVFAVAFSPDGKRLASASQDRTVKMWDVASGRRLYTLSDALDGLTGVAFSPSGAQVAAAGYDKTIYIWELTEEGGTLSRSLIADEESLLALLWSPDGKSIVTGSSDGTIRFRSTKLDLVGTIDRQSDWVESLDTSRDGKWLAAGRYNGTLSLYDTATYKEGIGQITVFTPRAPKAGNAAREAASR
jgi:DNA-binding beta-propeller fold protein YncE